MAIPQADLRVPSLAEFEGRRVLLLQGPMGPFFRRLARDLKAHGAEVHKINFNGGDWAFYFFDSCNFRGTLAEWPAFLRDFVTRHRIDTVMLYGDCRPVHEPVFSMSEELGLTVYTFEEGYIRSNFVTLEKGRVNGLSQLPRDPAFYWSLPDFDALEERRIGNTYWHMAGFGFVYHVLAWLFSLRFPHGRANYHRGLGARELWPQIKSVWRKVYYAIADWPASRRVLSSWKGAYFLVPLQVATDAQVVRYSPFVRANGTQGDLPRFIREVMASFARHAPAHTLLVFKHHPMDRGYNHYGRLIRQEARRLGIADRVVYFVKNVHLPTLLDHARGVVVINSTVGLQAIRHERPVIVLGTAIYDMEGLTAQVELDRFWNESLQHAPDPRLVRRYVGFLRRACQINGSFYRRLKGHALACGMDWPTEPAGDDAIRALDVVRTETEKA